MLEFLIALITIALVVAMTIPIALWFAFAATHLWAWFVVPAFHAPTLSVLQMWGICITFALMRPNVWANKVERDWPTSFTSIILGPALALGIGYVIRFHWM